MSEGGWVDMGLSVICFTRFMGDGGRILASYEGREKAVLGLVQITLLRLHHRHLHHSSVAQITSLEYGQSSLILEICSTHVLVL